MTVCLLRHHAQTRQNLGTQSTLSVLIRLKTEPKTSLSARPFVTGMNLYLMNSDS